MKVAFVGNQDNNAYRYCLWMRQRGVDAHLYLIRNEPGPRSRPEDVDVGLIASRQDWIHEYGGASVLSLLRADKLARQIEEQYDAIITSGISGLLAARHFRRAPLIHLTLGSEVNDYPLRLFKLRAGGFMWRGAAYLLRRGLKRADRIVTHGFWPEMRALDRLGMLDKTAIWGFPEDAHSNADRVNPERLAELNRQYGDYERVFVWLSRVAFLDPRRPGYKGTEKFLEAFERTVLTNKRNVRAVIGAHGEDWEAFEQLVADRCLEEYIDFVPHLPFWEVLTYCSMARGVVVDVPDMEHGHILGGIVRESLSIGSAVIAAWDEEVVGLCYGEGCPVLKAWDADSCHQAMSKTIAMSDEELGQLRQRSISWAREHLHYERRIDELIDLLGETIYCRSFRRGRRRQ